MKIFYMVRCVKENCAEMENSDTNVYFDIVETTTTKKEIQQKLDEYEKEIEASGFQCSVREKDSREFLSSTSDVAVSFNIFEKHLVPEEDMWTEDYFETYMKEYMERNVASRIKKKHPGLDSFVDPDEMQEFLVDAAEKYFENLQEFNEREFGFFTDEIFNYYDMK